MNKPLPASTQASCRAPLARVIAVAGIVAAGVLLGGARGGAPLRDRPEPGLQGQTEPGDAHVLDVPYSKGVSVVGHAPLGGRDSNIQLAWAGTCAYVSSTPADFRAWQVKARPETFGVAVVDVRDPAKPRQVELLRGRGATYAGETLHAVEAPGRSLLAAGSYGSPDDAAYTDLYDVSRCTKPRHVAEIKWPRSVHTLTFSPNGRRLYGTVIDPVTGAGGIIVYDLSTPSRPRLLGKFGATTADGGSFEFAAHEISFSRDERRIYAGVIAAREGSLARPAGIAFPSLEAFGPEAGGALILDNSDIVAGRPDPKMRVVGSAPGGGWHSVMPARIRGRDYLVGGAELGACPGAWPRITGIEDERQPRLVGEFRLAMNRPENCPASIRSASPAAQVTGTPGTATLHFNDVDSSEHTRLGLFNFMWAGLRIVDLREPSSPAEIGYFKPGDQCTGHVRYVQRTGRIWATCAASGFYVLELNRSIRAALHSK